MTSNHIQGVYERQTRKQSPFWNLTSLWNVAKIERKLEKNQNSRKLLVLSQNPLLVLASLSLSSLPLPCNQILATRLMDEVFSAMCLLIDGVKSNQVAKLDRYLITHLVWDAKWITKWHSLLCALRESTWQEEQASILRMVTCTLNIVSDMLNYQLSTVDYNIMLMASLNMYAKFIRTCTMYTNMTGFFFTVVVYVVSNMDN